MEINLNSANVSEAFDKGRTYRLFSLYLNDLEHYLLNNGAPSLDLQNENLDLFVKFVILLYADDTVISADSEDHLMDSLYILGIVKSGNSR